MQTVESKVRKGGRKPRASTESRSAAPSNIGRKRTTAMTFTGEDLAGLARLVAAGELTLQLSHPVVARMKAAMTRMGVPVPRGM